MRARKTLSVGTLLVALLSWNIAAAQTIEQNAQKRRAAPAAQQKAKQPLARPGAKPMPGARPGMRPVAPGAPRLRSIARPGIPSVNIPGVPRTPGVARLPGVGPGRIGPAGRTLPGQAGQLPGLRGPRGANLGPARGPSRNANIGQPPGRGVAALDKSGRQAGLPRPGSTSSPKAGTGPAGRGSVGRLDQARIGDPRGRGVHPGNAGRGGALQRQGNLPRPGNLARPMSPARSQALTAFRTRSTAWNRAAFQRRFIPPPRSPGPPPGLGVARTLHERQFSGVPPVNETRFVSNEVVVQVANSVPREQVDALARQSGVTVIASQSLDATGRTLYHFRAGGGRNVRDVVRTFEQNRIVASAQPNYVFQLSQPAAAASNPPSAEAEKDAPAEVAARDSLPAGDASQYTVEKLHLSEIHQQSRGRDVAVAVIDSEIDAQHPDLKGAIKERFDSTRSRANPHAHGTGMAGAIVAKHRLLGVAPNANIIAIKAFGENNASAEATSFQILQGIDHAMKRGVRIINMSFAGPHDVMIERKLREAYDKGIVLIAAAGNAGPKSPPLYPAADRNVIAVTATDAEDKPFDMANRGKHIALAAPGVDILVPAPRGDYQLTTGTSVAAAHVSGVVALLLEKRPTLTPDEVRYILAGTARPVLANDKAHQTGAGLVNPVQAMAYEQLPSEEEEEQPAAATAAQ